LLDLLYGAAVGARRRWYERHPEARRRLRQPVISIGNLSVGGTGKTPVVSLVAEYLLSRGERPAILSRGYGREAKDAGALVISEGQGLLPRFRATAAAAAAGDEPLMLARALPNAIVVVAEDRHLAGVLAERRLGATVHILDDGFQHVRLARDLDVLVTSPGEIPSGRVLPFGRLRESRAAAARAHVVVVVGADEATARAEAWTLGVSEWVAARRTLPAPSRGERSIEPVVAVAGIGSPQQFFNSLAESGWNVVRTLAFADHHRYGRRDVADIADAARATNAPLVVTTAKDHVRFEGLGDLPFRLVTVPLVLELDPADGLFKSIDAALSRAREAA
jgi:tetraacyldisaccharide 4'-kinase